MKNSPFTLAFFFVLITIARVATYVVFGLQIGILGYAFAVGLTCGVYVSAYFMEWKETRAPGIIALIFFGVVDMVFNTLETARTLAGVTLIPEGSQFIGVTASQLTVIMQWSGVIWAVFPTLASALLGWLQAGARKVAQLNKPSLLSRISSALGRVVTGWGVAVAVKLEGGNGNAVPHKPNVPKINGQIQPRRWSSLTAAEAAKVPHMSRAQIMADYGISDGAAGDWIRRLRAGEKPWLNGVEVTDEKSA